MRENLNITDAVFSVARQRPEQAAIEDDGGSMTYAQLLDAVARGQNVLASWGISPGDRVGIPLRDQKSMLILMLACARLGATCLPIDGRTAPHEQAVLLDLFETPIALTDGRAPDDGRFKSIDPEWWTQAEPAPTTPCSHSFPWTIALSSGTTGLPSGAVVTHEALFVRLQHLQNLFRDDSVLRYLAIIPLSFSGGITDALFHLVDGNTILFYPPLFEPEELAAVVVEKAIDYVFVPPAALRGLLTVPRTQEPLFPSVKYLRSVAAFMSPEEKQLAATHLCPHHYHTFGVAGAGSLSTLRPEELHERGASVGRPDAQLEVHVIDDQGRILPACTEGQLAVRGPTVPREFIGADAGLDAEGWYRTGDVAELDSDGYLYIRGRASDFINRGGSNVYAGLVEQQLAKHPRIEEVAVVGRVDADGEEDIVAFAAVDGGVTIEELEAFARSQLSGAMQPAEFRIVAELPKTATGKVRKGELRELALDSID